MSLSRSLLLHACCAPCSTAAVEKILNEFDGSVTLFYYNPNISPQEEAVTRFRELERYLKERYGDKISAIEGEYDFERWYDLVAPLKSTGEKGERCRICYYLRILETFRTAENKGFSHASTTLSISPHKNFDWLTETGETLSKHFGIEWIADRWDYRRSVELSKEYNLYRQNYCGCAFSLAESRLRRAASKR